MSLILALSIPLRGRGNNDCLMLFIDRTQSKLIYG